MLVWCPVNPGFGGQGFIQSQISKIARLRHLCNELGVNPWIEVDGGIGPGNAAEVRFDMCICFSKLKKSAAVWVGLHF